MGSETSEVSMKVFLSHQRADSIRAHAIRDRLSRMHQIECYLDIIDDQLGKSGPDLATYLRREIGKCTHLLAVTSFATKDSQWVPWEIGIATEKEYPLATFADYMTAVPEFLAAWPYLRTMEHVDAYARAAKSSLHNYIVRKATVSEFTARHEAAQSFYKSLRAALDQPLDRAK